VAYAQQVQVCQASGGKMAYTPEQSFPGGVGHCVDKSLDTAGMTEAQLSEAAHLHRLNYNALTHQAVLPDARVLPGVIPIPPGSLVPQRVSLWDRLWACQTPFCQKKYSFYSYGGFGIVAIGIGAYWWSRR
jgi:hypothetical protein